MSDIMGTLINYDTSSTGLITATKGSYHKDHLQTSIYNKAKVDKKII